MAGCAFILRRQRLAAHASRRSSVRASVVPLCPRRGVRSPVRSPELQMHRRVNERVLELPVQVLARSPRRPPACVCDANPARADTRGDTPLLRQCVPPTAWPAGARCCLRLRPGRSVKNKRDSARETGPGPSQRSARIEGPCHRRRRPPPHHSILAFFIFNTKNARHVGRRAAVPRCVAVRRGAHHHGPRASDAGCQCLTEMSITCDKGEIRSSLEGCRS